MVHVPYKNLWNNSLLLFSFVRDINEMFFFKVNNNFQNIYKLFVTLWMLRYPILKTLNCRNRHFQEWRDKRSASVVWLYVSTNFPTRASAIGFLHVSVNLDARNVWVLMTKWKSMLKVYKLCYLSFWICEKKKKC